MCFLVYLAGSPSGDRASSVGGAPRVGLESEVATSRHFSLKAYHTTSSRQRYCIIMNMNGRGSQPFHQRGSQFHRNNYGRSDVPIFRRGNDRGGGHSNQQRSYEQHYVGRNSIGHGGTGRSIGGNARQHGPPIRQDNQIIFRGNDRGRRSNQQHNVRRSHNVGRSIGGNVGRSIGGNARQHGPPIRQDDNQIIFRGVGTFSSSDATNEEIQRYHNKKNKKQRNTKPTPRDRGRFDNLSTAASSTSKKEIEKERKRMLEFCDTLAAKAPPIKKRLPSGDIALWSAPPDEEEESTNQTNETTSSSTSSTSSSTSESAASETSVPSNDVGASASMSTTTATSTAAPSSSTTATSSTTSASSSQPEESTAGLESPPEDQYQALPIVSYDTAVKNYQRMVNIKSKMEKAVTEDQKKRLKAVDELLRRYLIQFYHAHCKKHNIVPRPITWDDTGCYLILDSGKKGQTLRPVPLRIMEQSSADDITSVNEIAALLFTTLECRTIMGGPEFKQFVEAIIKLDPPRLHYHKEMREKKVDSTVQMFIEGAVAVCTNESPGEVFELFTMQPSKEIKNIVSLPEYVDPRAVELLQLVRDIEGQFTWGTFRSFQESLKTSPYLSEESRAFLATKLRDVPNDEFNQLHMVLRSLGHSPMWRGYTDSVSVEYDVRAAQLDKLVVDLLEVFNENVMTYYKATGKLPDDSRIVKNTLKLIGTIDKQSGDYEHYKPCEKKALVDGGVHHLNEKMERGDNSTRLILLEFEQYNAIKDLDLVAHQKIFPSSSTVVHQNDSEGDLAAILIQTPKGLYLITYSFHCILSEEMSLVIRIKTIRRFIATMTLLNKAGIVSDEALEEEVKVWQAFLMTWVGFNGWLNLDKLELSVFKGSFLEARHNASGQGFFLTPATEGVLTTAKRIGIGSLEALYLRLFLGMEIFNAMLSACEVDIDAYTSSPIEIDSTCSCCEETATRCPGADVVDWSLLYTFTCNRCSTFLHRHEIRHLIQRLQDGYPLTPTQFERVRAQYQRENETAEKDKVRRATNKSNKKNTKRNENNTTVRGQPSGFKPSSICQLCPDDLDEHEYIDQMGALVELEAEKEKRKSDNRSKAARDRTAAPGYKEAWQRTFDENEAKKNQEIIDSGRSYVKITCQDKDCDYHFLLYKSDYEDKKRLKQYKRRCKMCTRRLNHSTGQERTVDGDIVGDKYWKVEAFNK